MCQMDEMKPDAYICKKVRKKPQKNLNQGLTYAERCDIINELDRESTAPNLENDTEMTNAIKKTVIPNELKSCQETDEK